MAAAIDFYFDFTSPYGYLASTAINALAAKYERSVNWHPVLLGAVFKTTGGLPLVAIPLKGPYSERDILRTTVDAAWQSTRSFWMSRDPSQVSRAEADPRHDQSPGNTQPRD